MCALCRRNLLEGERYRLWVGADPTRRAARAVCALCEPAARGERWVRTAGRPLYEPTASTSGSVRRVA